MTTSRFAGGLAPWALLAAALLLSAKATAADDPAAEQLRKEVGKKGWIVMALHAQEVEARRRLPDDEAGQADLYLMRPDGSEMKNITNTPDRHEFFARFSEGGTKGNPDKHRCFYIIRRSDAPIIQPGFEELRKLNPNAKAGPVLQPRLAGGRPMVTVFVAGDWTYAEIGGGK
jgi:hypothetical protein